jgi:RNA polymerase sigma-70 factor (ECF subfamily)
MPSPSPPPVTQLLADWSNGDPQALDRLIPLVQPELRRLARHYMRRARPGHTLQTSALVNEAYLRLVDQTHVRWQDRTHFFAFAAQLMRRIMVDHARERHALKRGGAAPKVTLDEAAGVTEDRPAQMLALDQALSRLAAFDPRKCQIVEMRHFGGLTVEEVAEVLKIHPNTVTRDWNAARAWLYAELSGRSRDEG